MQLTVNFFLAGDGQVTSKLSKDFDDVGGGATGGDLFNFVDEDDYYEDDERVKVIRTNRKRNRKYVRGREMGEQI